MAVSRVRKSAFRFVLVSAVVRRGLRLFTAAEVDGRLIRGGSGEGGSIGRFWG